MALQRAHVLLVLQDDPVLTVEVDLVADIFDEGVDEVQQKVGKDLWKKIGRGFGPT